MSAISFQQGKISNFIKTMEKRNSDIEARKKNYSKAISARVFKDVIDHFKKQQGADGAWKKWSPSYDEQQKRRGKSGNKILQDSGKLRQSFLPQNFRRDRKGIIFFNPAKTKSGFPYAKAHDEGMPGLPQREFMWLSKGAMKDIGRLTLNFLFKK